MERKCEYCGEVFEGERESGRFCKPSCRKLAFRTKRVSVAKDDLSVPLGGLSVPKELSVPLSVPEKLEAESGDIREEKLRELRATDLPSVSIEEPCNVPVRDKAWGEVFRFREGLET